METNSSIYLAFCHSLIQVKILSYLDIESLKNVRYVCANWSDAGGNVLSKSNQYFKLGSSAWNNRSYVREFNLQKVHWMKNNLKDHAKFWLFQKVELPFLEALESEEIRDLFIKHGHLIKKLRLVKFDAFRKKLIKGEKVPKNVKIAENCPSPHHLLHLILTSWCPSLLELSIVEKLTLLMVEELYIIYNDTTAREKGLPAFKPTSTGFEKTLNLKSFAIKSNAIGSLFGKAISIEYLREIIISSPKLINLKVSALNGLGRDLADELIPKDENSGFYNLQKLSVPKTSKRITFIKQITEEKFPRLKKLSLGYNFEYEHQRLNYDDVILKHNGIKNVTITKKFKMGSFSDTPYFVTILRLIPHATSLKFIYAQQVYPNIDVEWVYLLPMVDNFCKPSHEKYGNIKELILEINFRHHVLRVVDFVGELCPNLMKFKLNGVDKDLMHLSLLTVVEHMLEKMRNLTFFQLFVDNADWVDEEWDEIVKLVPVSVSFRIGDKEQLKLWQYEWMINDRPTKKYERDFLIS